ncbi:predicted permeases [Firmicutes bacterium CAG:882]|nr:predicted permeases [Firmicutes bacterium CAG:882]
MADFIFSLNATLPIFLIMVLGWFLMRIGLFTKEFNKVADKYVFKVALPVLLFKDIATADIRSDFNLTFVLFCMITTTIMFLAIWGLSYIFIKDKTQVGAFAQASARGSAAVLGIAFINNIYGNSGMAPLMIVSAVPLYNILSVIILTFSADMGKEAQKNKLTDNVSNSKGSNIKKACINVVKNPIIIGIFLGLPFSIFGISIPPIPLKAVTSIAQTATPIALLVVGAGFEGAKAIKKIKLTAVATFIKLVLLPLIFFPFAIAFGFRGSELVAILIMLGSPTTVTCYIMAKNMGNDEVLSSSIVVMATLLSSVTLTGWIFVLKVMGLI